MSLAIKGKSTTKTLMEGTKDDDYGGLRSDLMEQKRTKDDVALFGLMRMRERKMRMRQKNNGEEGDVDLSLMCMIPKIHVNQGN